MSYRLEIARLRFTVSPGATESAIVGPHDDGWKVRVAAPPERGRANEAVLALVAQALEVPRGDLRVVAGHSSRRKTIEVPGLGDEEAARRLDAASAR